MSTIHKQGVCPLSREWFHTPPFLLCDDAFAGPCWLSWHGGRPDRTHTHTQQPSPLAPGRIPFHYMVKLRHSWEYKHLNFSVSSFIHKHTHTDRVTLTSNCTTRGSWGGIPASFTLSPLLCSLPTEQREWKMEKDGENRRWYPHLITMATQQDQFPACKVLASQAVAAVSWGRELICW